MSESITIRGPNRSLLEVVRPSDYCSIAECAEEFGVGKTTIRSWCMYGAPHIIVVSARKRRSHRPHRKRFREWVDHYKDAEPQNLNQILKKKPRNCLLSDVMRARRWCDPLEYIDTSYMGERVFIRMLGENQKKERVG